MITLDSITHTYPGENEAVEGSGFFGPFVLRGLF